MMTYHSKVSEIPYIENYLALMVSICAGVNPESAFKRLGTSCDVKKKRPAKHWDGETIQKAADLKNSGLTWLEVGEKMGIEEIDSIRLAVYKEKIPLKKSHKVWSDEDMEKVDRMRKAGVKWEEIGKVFNVPATTVASTYLRRKGTRNDR